MTKSKTTPPAPPPKAPDYDDSQDTGAVCPPHVARAPYPGSVRPKPGH